MRGYGQYCGLARALELVGERWALLIIRNLLVGPKRFSDLKHGIPRIPTNVLTDRLKELEEAALVQRRVLPRPASGVVYELTEYGSDLEDAVVALSRWGARSLGEMRPEEIVTVDSMTMAFRTTFRPAAALGLFATYELRMGPIVLCLHVQDGKLLVEEGPAPDADIVVEAGTEIRALMAGEVSPARALADGSVRIEGDAALLDRFVQVFRI